MWFRIASRSILFLFMAIMLFVVFVAYTHKSGSMGIDIATLHLLRMEK